VISIFSLPPIPQSILYLSFDLLLSLLLCLISYPKSVKCWKCSCAILIYSVSYLILSNLILSYLIGFLSRQRREEIPPHLRFSDSFSVCYVFHDSFFFCLIFDPEDGGEILLRNIGWLLVNDRRPIEVATLAAKLLLPPVFLLSSFSTSLYSLFLIPPFSHFSLPHSFSLPIECTASRCIFMLLFSISFCHSRLDHPS
jgi:hypothetical protein